MALLYSHMRPEWIVAGHGCFVSGLCVFSFICILLHAARKAMAAAAFLRPIPVPDPNLVIAGLPYLLNPKAAETKERRRRTKKRDTKKSTA